MKCNWNVSYTMGIMLKLKISFTIKFMELSYHFIHSKRGGKWAIWKWNYIHAYKGNRWIQGVYFKIFIKISAVCDNFDEQCFIVFVVLINNTIVFLKTNNVCTKTCIFRNSLFYLYIVFKHNLKKKDILSKYCETLSFLFAFSWIILFCKCY